MEPDLINVLNDALESSTEIRIGSPWKLTLQTSAGGALAAGFDRVSETLVIVSENGQGIYDTATGSRIYRNYEESGYELSRLEATRLDEISTPPIPIAGEYGGGLCRTTSDGWSIDTLQIKWPTAYSLLHPPKASIFFLAPEWHGLGKDASFQIAMKSEGLPVAFGFSWSGKSLIWLDRSDLLIWYRDIP